MALGEGTESLSVELDRPDGRYRAGETVRGVVTLGGVDERVRGVDVKLRWSTSGKGNTDQQDVRTLRLPVAALGGRARTTFELPLPSGPVSYQGPIIQVAWQVLVSVDVAWARDPSRELPIEVLPGDPYAGADVYRASAAPLRHALGPDTEPAGSTKARSTGMTVAGTVLFGAFATQFGTIGYVLAPLFFLAAGATLWGAARRSGARHVLGEPRFELVPAELRRGESITARVTVQPRRAMAFVDGDAELHGREIAVHGGGSSATTHNQDLHRDEVELEGPSELRAGQLITLSATLQLPRDAAPSFGSPSNHVSWTVTIAVRARTAGGVKHELEEELVLHVQPS